MANFVPCNREQAFLLLPDLKDWLPDDDLAHFIIAAAERVAMSAFKINHLGTGKAQYNPRMMLALLIYCYANGIFSSRHIEMKAKLESQDGNARYKKRKQTVEPVFGIVKSANGVPALLFTWPCQGRGRMDARQPRLQLPQDRRSASRLNQGLLQTPIANALKPD